jgi:hypothetical protein
VLFARTPPMTQRRRVKFLKVKAVDPPLGVHRIVRPLSGRFEKVSKRLIPSSCGIEWDNVIWLAIEVSQFSRHATLVVRGWQTLESNRNDSWILWHYIDSSPVIAGNVC